jgi:haloacetate dehalogenase
MDFSLGFWLWSFLAAPEPVPEQLIAQAPAVIVNHMLDSLSEVPDAFPAEVRAAHIAKFSAADTIHAICEQYRAAATLDYQHDEADRGRRRITCPTLALWSQSGAVAGWYQPLEVWRTWAEEVHGGPIAAGHFLPEEAPDQTARHLVSTACRMLPPQPRQRPPTAAAAALQCQLANSPNRKAATSTLTRGVSRCHLAARRSGHGRGPSG